MAVPKRKTRATRPLVRTARARAVQMSVGVEVARRHCDGSRWSVAASRWCEMCEADGLSEPRRTEEAVEGGGEEEREQDVGDEDAGEEKDSGGGEDAEAGVEGGAGAEGLAAQR